MSARDREWLRKFLQLGAGAEKDGIPVADVERQEDTVLRALDMLDERPGVVLADEVGMGKTYEALGIAAAMRHQNPRGRIVVITPGPDLNTKWYSEFSKFRERELYDFGGKVEAVRGLSGFVKAVNKPGKGAVVVAPVSMFQSGHGAGDQIYLLSLFIHWRKFHGHTANAIMSRFKGGEHVRVDVTAERFLGVFDIDQVEPHLKKAFQSGQSGGSAGLDDLYDSDCHYAFENENAVRNALNRARFILTGELMPKIDLLIVDEAHKLKNPGSLRTKAMRSVFDGRFRKALFLTATPFQLNVGELGEVFSFFARAKDAPSGLEEIVAKLLDSVTEYQRIYGEFQQTWSSLNSEDAAEFRKLYDEDQLALDEIGNPWLKEVARHVADLKKLKTETIEPGFREWMLRSLRKDKRTYRRHRDELIPAKGDEVLPFLIYERFIAELYRRGRSTHKSAAEINMVSSHAAARRGEIISREDGVPPEAEAYRDLLKGILDGIKSSAGDHPKIDYSTTGAIGAADQDEKTLIFCSRIATLRQLRSELSSIWKARILERWKRVYPNAGEDEIFGIRVDGGKRRRGRHSRMRARFHNPRDCLYLALREPYLRTLVPAAEWALRNLEDVVKEANRILLDVRVGESAAERLDHQVAKRCVEQAVVRLFPDEIPSEIGDTLLDDDYVRLGLDLNKDADEDDPVGDRKPRWEVTGSVARMVIGGEGTPWVGLTEPLDNLQNYNLRVRVVEWFARYLTSMQVPFLADLLGEAAKAGVGMDPVESSSLLDFMPTFWQTDVGSRWLERLRSFLDYFLQRDDQQREEILDGLSGLRGAFVRHTRQGESRERLREAFNTPLHPMVLIANKVMEEGLDLHRHCRRVVHHDLVWNPAQVEQRIGRIDRLGSLTDRLRKNGADVKLDIFYPMIRGTIDVRLYRTVKTREKWLEFLLGATPNFSEYEFNEEKPPALPEKLGADLTIDLSPR